MMRNSIFRHALLAAVCSLISPTFAGEPAPAGLEGIPEIVAEVQGKPIRRYELIRELVGSAGTRALERIVNRILIEQSAAQRNILITPQDIELQFARDQTELAQTFIRMPWMNKGNKIPIDDIIQAQFGMSVADYKNIVVRQRLLSRRCMAREISPIESELKKFFDSYPDLFQHPTKYRASHILITPLNPNDLYLGSRLRNDVTQKTDYQSWLNKRLQRNRDNNIKLEDENVSEVDTAWAQARAKAEQLATQLLANPNRWNEYVSTFSQDPMDRARIAKGGARLKTQREMLGLKMVPGDVDWFHKNGPLVREFYLGAKDLKEGQISLPIRTQFGYHIIKMLKIYRPPVITYADVKDRVRELFIENEIQLLSASWLAQLTRIADLKTEKATLWPPRSLAAKTQIGLPDPGAEPELEDADPIVGRVNGVPIKRSEIWRDLLLTEGEEALRRLINREVVMGILKQVGVPHMEWLCANPHNRPLQGPPTSPIRLDEEHIQKQLNDDRLEYDRVLTDEKEYANLSFEEYVYKRYGQTPAEYRRAIEAGMIMMTAIRQKLIPNSRADFERTLRFEFALARPQYSDDAWFEVSHILIQPAGGMLKADADDLFKALATATELHQRCVAEPDKWPEHVANFSDDNAENKAANGFLGACYDRSMPNFPESVQFYNEIVKQNLEPGQITPVLKTARGYHIVRLDKKFPARQAEYRDKRKQVERDYINERAKYYSEIWVRALNSRAIVKHFYFKPTLSYNESDVEEIKLPPDTFTLPKN